MGTSPPRPAGRPRQASLSPARRERGRLLPLVPESEREGEQPQSPSATAAPRGSASQIGLPESPFQSTALGPLTSSPTPPAAADAGETGPTGSGSDTPGGHSADGWPMQTPAEAGSPSIDPSAFMDTPDHPPQLRVRSTMQHTSSSSNPLFDGLTSDDGEVLHCPTMRHLLRPIPSPLLQDSYFGGGFVSDDDRVSLQSLLFAAPTSRGAGDVQRSISSMAQQPSSAMASAGRALCRTLSTPRSSMDTNQDAYFPMDSVPRYALRAGPRETIYYQPHRTKIAIVTCGGLVPGLNDVIRSIVFKALDYGVKEGSILGIRRGFKGFYTKGLNKPLLLTRESVADIHLEGGTVLGTSEGGECDVMAVVKHLDLWAVDQLFVIAGQRDISHAGVIQDMCQRCAVQCAVIALPKSIDNDMLMLDKTFGYETAVEEAQKALLAAKFEATSAYRGVGIVKLMGKHSGFIAVKAALSSGLVDIVLVPEVSFQLDWVLDHLEKLLEERGHVVVCMAEGAGQERFPQCRPGDDPFACRETDVGPWLKGEIRKRLQDVDCKYIDPSYLIRSIAATSDDRVHCKMVAHGAVHAAFAGYTSIAVGQISNHMVFVPLRLLAQTPRQMDPNGELWNRMRAAIGQPTFNH